MRNLTEENRAALDKKITELRQTELLRMTRGRIKPSPVLLPFFTSYQALLLNRDILLETQLKDYASALAEAARAKSDFADFAASGPGVETIKIFDARLIDAYSISGKINAAKTMWEVWMILAASKSALRTLPVELRLALNAGKWLERTTPSGIPGPFLDRYFALCRGIPGEPAPTDVFAADTRINGISAKYSQLILDLTIQGGATPK